MVVVMKGDARDKVAAQREQRGGQHGAAPARRGRSRICSTPPRTAKPSRHTRAAAHHTASLAPALLPQPPAASVLDRMRRSKHPADAGASAQSTPPPVLSPPLAARHARARRTAAAPPPRAQAGAAGKLRRRSDARVMRRRRCAGAAALAIPPCCCCSAAAAAPSAARQPLPRRVAPAPSARDSTLQRALQLRASLLRCTSTSRPALEAFVRPLRRPMRRTGAAAATHAS